MRYICYFNEKEYVTAYDTVENNISVSDKEWKAIIFDDEREASYVAEYFGCYYRKDE